MSGKSPMSKNLLNELESGLQVLCERIQVRKNDLLARLAKEEKISDEDETWLNNKANLVDEESLVTSLQASPNLKAALSALNETQRTALDRLRNANLRGDCGNKRKCVYSSQSDEMLCTDASFSQVLRQAIISHLPRSTRKLLLLLLCSLTRRLLCWSNALRSSTGITQMEQTKLRLLGILIRSIQI